MAGWGWTRPRDSVGAARGLLALAVTAAAVTGLAAALQLDQTGAVMLTGTLLALGGVVGLACYVRATARTAGAGWIVAPVSAIVVITLLDLCTADASAAGQVFLFLPLMWAASYLPRPAVALVCVAAVLADITVVAVLDPVRAGIVDILYVGTALIAAAVLLHLSGDRARGLQDRLHAQASIDPLTDLATRRVFHLLAEAALASRTPQAGTALILLDLDDFKPINDTHGHPAGDQVLMELAQLLRHQCRADDLVSRLGGDEFAILLTDADLAAALHRAQAVRTALAEATFLITSSHDQPVKVSIRASFGVSHSPTHAHTLEDLYASADRALYTAKHAGRNQIATLPS